MIDKVILVERKEECYNCGCNLKKVCPDYEEGTPQVRVQRLHEEAKMPVRAHDTDAGMDLFFCPPPNDMIPKQIESIFPQNKAGIASKRGLLVGACVVDRGYTGEIFVNLHNPSDRSQTLHAGDKIAQAVFVKITTDIKLVEAENIYDEETSRADGALGSTGDR